MTIQRFAAPTMPMLPATCAAMLTPLDETGAIDLPRMITHGRWLLDNGCDGLALFGTTGEGPSFGLAERRGAVEAMLDAGFAGETLIVGTGCAAVTDSIELTSHALASGVGAVLVHPPFFFRPAVDQGVTDYYRMLIDRLGSEARDIVLYHFPDATGAAVGPDVVETLVRAFPGIIVGVKDSSGSLDNMVQLVRRFPWLAIFSGDDNLLLPLLEAGGHGIISANANIVPSVLRQLSDARQSDIPATEAAHATLVQLWDNAITRFAFTPALKEVLASATRDAGWLRMRPPLQRLSLPQRRDLAQRFRPFATYFPPPPAIPDRALDKEKVPS